MRWRLIEWGRGPRVASPEPIAVTPPFKGYTVEHPPFKAELGFRYEHLSITGLSLEREVPDASRRPLVRIVHDEAPELIETVDAFGGFSLGGSGGIRTHGAGLPHNGFQDRLLRPLGHASLGSLMPVTAPE